MNPLVSKAVRRHSLAWLVAANGVGVLLAALLIWPDLNDLLAPLTYGRWIPLHLNGHLYGWGALPLVGALFKFYLPEDASSAHGARFALWVWSGALLYGCLTWLAGHTSGKIFLDWQGGARWGWSFALFFLWLILFRQARRPLSRSAQGLLGLLLLIPFLLYWVAGATVYPAINPHSGGATGASLLGSTLGVVAMFGALPWLLRLEVKAGQRPWRIYLAAFALTSSVYAGIGHGAASHHRPDQIIGLSCLLAWIPLVWSYARAFKWRPGSGRWLTAAFCWWVLLVITGLLIFLPEISERLKFTNALVAHSHLAMAGLITSFHLVILLNLAPARSPQVWSFWAWQLGCLLQVALLFWLGWQEGLDPAILYLRGGLTDWVYGLRLIIGLVMFVSSFVWLTDMGRTIDADQNH